jgi:hypothetical protein
MTTNTHGRRGVLVPLAIGLVAGILTLASALDDPRRALLGWIAAYVFGAATVLGAMILVMVLNVSGARWWLVLRRVFLATAGTAPLLVLLFVPIGAAFSIVYPWASTPGDLPLHTAEALQHQQAWNRGGFFLARSAVYLATWTALAVLLRRADVARLERSTEITVRRELTLSAIGLPLLGFTLTFASFDWLMSLQAGWTSNVFGVYVFTSGLISALSVIAIGGWLAERSGVLESVQPDHVHAVGRLMLMAVILWSYIAFFQLALVWIADLPHEVAFYVVRARGAWVVVDVVLFAGRFVIPLFALLSRPLKRSPRMLAGVAMWLLATSVVDFAWLALPAFGARLAFADLLPFVAVGGLLWTYGAHLVEVRGRAAARAGALQTDPMRDEALRYRSP